MKKALVSMFVGFFLMAVTGEVFAIGTAADAKAMVEKAVAFYKANGKDKAFAEINNAKGQFAKDDLYVWVSDLKMTVLAHGANQKLIGKELVDLKDTDGKLFMKEIGDGAKAKGSGWADYKWTNPTTKKVELKSTYFQREGDLIFACGIYKQ